MTMTCRRGAWLTLAALGWACGSSDPATGHIDGTVTGAAAVVVRLSCADGVWRSTRADAQGQFAFDGVPAQTCTLTPDLAGYRFEPASVVVVVDPATPSTAAFAASPLVLQVRGSDLSGSHAFLDVMVADQEVEGALVEINGQVIPFEAALGRYSSDLTPEVAVGGTLSLEVSYGGLTVTGTGSVPENPTLVAPVSGEDFSFGEDLVVNWTSTTSPDAFVVFASWSCGPNQPNCGTGTGFEAAGSARSLTIPAGALPPGAIELYVLAYNNGELAGDYEPAANHPGMNIRGESAHVDVTVVSP
jgi:hypothetical protein